MISRAANSAVRRYSSSSSSSSMGSTSKSVHAVASKGFNLQTDAYGKWWLIF